MPIMDSMSSNMPSLWIFLVIVLAVLLGVVLCTSFVMHMIQRRQRRHLERRIANGEVDLETLGIKRLNVPQEAIEKMPLYKFKSVAESNLADRPPSTSKLPTPQDFFQPTCSICLDDFVLNETEVRELPCKHIFHPECIDPFLRENSSLCPLCKRSALPPGYCPITVTNVMVRRERLARRMRERPQLPITRYVPPRSPTAWDRRLERIRGPSAVAAPQPAVIRHEGVTHGTAEEVPDTTPVTNESDVEMGTINPEESAAPDAMTPPPEIARRGTAARRAWRRERIASMHVRQYDAQAEEARREDERRPLWRRALGLA